MRIEKTIERVLRLLGLMGLLVLTGCSSDENEEQKTSMQVEMTGYVTEYQEIEAPATRAWTPPTGFSLLDQSKSISIFLTQTTGGPFKEEYFFKSSGSWRLSKDELTAGTFYLYGYIPHDESITATVNMLEGKTFADGAVLTLQDLPTTTPEDVCVVIGAKNGTSADVDGGLKKGQFEYVATGGGNYVFLLFDHLYAGLRIGMKVDGDYGTMRTIKLKELKVRTASATAATKKNTTATITLTTNSDGSNPITDVTFTQSGEDTSSNSVFKSTDGIPLPTTSFEPFDSYFMPVGITNLIVTSTYDVYDSNNNLIRKGCEAENTIPISRFGNAVAKFNSGTRYTINMTILPTYLYVLSEPDLDNPTVVVD